MKINKMNVVELRNRLAWSQEDLAAASDLSVRTIQRVETNGIGSLETCKALAAAFNIDIAKIREPEWGWHHVAMFLKPFWPICFAGFVMAIAGAFITAKGLVSEPTAGYWAGIMLTTLTGLYFFECYKFYRKEFGP